jgi:hypothetical protein
MENEFKKPEGQNDPKPTETQELEPAKKEE